MEQVI